MTNELTKMAQNKILNEDKEKRNKEYDVKIINKVTVQGETSEESKDSKKQEPNSSEKKAAEEGKK